HGGRVKWSRSSAAQAAGNSLFILDLSTRAENERYTMILLLDMSSVKSLSGIRKALDGFSLKTGLNTELQHRDIFVATNEI
ncbi:MAG: hypothetical protein NT118_03145, partial [Lentisphaerae bacterium]|nr:hypothetical protein [Lentisphaerota bacterium]